MKLAIQVSCAALGALGLALGAWPLLTGRNFPGLLGRGFTQRQNIRLVRAPAIYFRAMGATVTSAGLAMLSMTVFIGLSSTPTAADLVLAATLMALGLIGVIGSVTWLFVVAYRHKMFIWDAP